MESTDGEVCNLTQYQTVEQKCNSNSSRSLNRKLEYVVSTCRTFNTHQSSRCLILLMVLSMASLVYSHMPDKYPIEVYHMLQERSQYGLGRDNRVRGNWGPWSSWSECSRSCGTGVQSQFRQCSSPRGLRKRSIIGQVDATSLKPICIGIHKRYHICNTQECPNYSGDIREEQCAKYNNRRYKGESYNWVPFLNAPNPCALNCRAVGQRFYATLEPQVIDGTPCDGPNLRGRSTGLSIDRTEQWLCIAGQCRAVGCDGVVGSGAVVDTCGVCGGQGRGCKQFEGIFMEPILPKGHQPVTTIPRGAMSLNISELRYTGNFLALRAENGSYILNGPNAVSPSGVYKIAATILKYQRGDKHRMESITATGPLNESLALEIWYHEMNPGVIYKYMLPAPEDINEDNAVIAPPLYSPGSFANEIPDSSRSSNTPADAASSILKLHVNRVNELKKNNNSYEVVKFSPTTVMAGDAPNANAPPKKKNKKKRKFAWKSMGLSSCSKSCGGGTQSEIFKCIRYDNNVVVPDRRCKKIERPALSPAVECNNHPCPARWRADAWSECSVTCGSGIKTRRLECVQDLNSKLTMRVPAGACPQPPDLSTRGTCLKPPCVIPEVRKMNGISRNTTSQWHVGEWSPCSSSCGTGIRNRTVTCITTRQPCAQSTKPIHEQSCETPCNSPSQSQSSIWLYGEWTAQCKAECGREVETRRVVCSHVNESSCDLNRRPIGEKRCSSDEEKSCNESKWFTGPWSSCSVICGEGVSRRDVICVDNSSGEWKIISESNCTLPRPHTQQNCKMPACQAEWYTSDWTQCSASCNGGTQERTVRCIENGLESSKCQLKSKPIARKQCNTFSCRNDTSYKVPNQLYSVEECVDKYPNCQLVVKAGLCRIKFYKHSCCGCRV